jgi:hypothetical protein
MRRYATKLLFAWDPDPVTGSRRTALFEERIVVFNARSARGALATAKRLGGDGELRYDSGLRLRFVGLMQVMELGLECADGEVWWEFCRRRMTIAEAKARLPAKKSLYVFTDGQKSAGSARATTSRPQPAASHLTNRFNRRPRRPRLSA